MSRPVKKPQEKAGALVVVYTRLRKTDLEELQRREAATGATTAAQIRILVHEGLKARGFVK